MQLRQQRIWIAGNKNRRKKFSPILRTAQRLSSFITASTQRPSAMARSLEPAKAARERITGGSHLRKKSPKRREWKRAPRPTLTAAARNDPGAAISCVQTHQNGHGNLRPPQRFPHQELTRPGSKHQTARNSAHKKHRPSSRAHLGDDPETRRS